MWILKCNIRTFFLRSLITAFLAGLFLPSQVSAQQAPVLDSLYLQINTVNTLELHYVLTFSEDIDRPTTLTHPPNMPVNIKLVRARNGEILASQDYGSVDLGNRRVDFTFKLSKSGKSLIAGIYERKEPVYVQLSGEIEILFHNTNQSYILTPGEVKKLTLEQSRLSDRQLESIKAYNDGASFALKNNVDFNREVNSPDSAASEYVLNFDIIKPVSSQAPLFLKAKGRIGTEPANPLNYSEFYLNYNVPGSGMFVEGGRIGKQDFSTNSIRGSFGLETLLPNLIDMTGGSARLRLKPYIKTALSFQKNFDSDNAFGNEDVNLVLTGEGYYYIPIGEQFFTVLTVDGNYSDAFDNDKFLFAYHMSLGYQTPLNDVKVLFQVQSGENEVNREASTRYLVGLLMNFIE